MTGQLHGWFKEEPWCSGRDLLEKLQAERPGVYLDGLIRAVQHRLTIWLSEHTRALVFNRSSMVPKPAVMVGLPTTLKG